MVAEARGRPSRTRSPRRRRELGFGGLGLLDRDHPLVADLFVASPMILPIAFAVGRDRADLGDLVGGLHLAGAPTGGLRSRRLSGALGAVGSWISCAAWRSNSERREGLQSTDRAERRSEWGGGKLKWLSRKRTLGPGPEPFLSISPNELPAAPFAAPFRATV
jgi:hypothetical protein